MYDGDILHEKYLIKSNIDSVSQIIFDGFSVGRFDEGLLDGDAERESTNPISHLHMGDLPGCPEGFMQVRLTLFLVKFN